MSCCVALQTPKQRTRPGRPEYGPVSGPDAGGAAAGNPSKCEMNPVEFRNPVPTGRLSLNQWPPTAGESEGEAPLWWRFC